MTKTNLTETKGMLHSRTKVLNEKKMKNKEMKVKRKENCVIVVLSPAKKRLN